MSMFNLIEHSDNYSKPSGSLWQYFRDDPALANGTIVDFPAANKNSASFSFKQKITGKTRADVTKDAEIIVPLKYLNNFGELLKCF